MSSMLSARAEELVEVTNQPQVPKLVAVQQDNQATDAPAAVDPEPEASEAADAEAPAGDTAPAEVAAPEDEEEDDAEEEESAPAAAAPAVVQESKTVKKTKSTAARRKPKPEAPVVPAPPAESNGRAHYTELIRKELRLHPGQSADLTILTVTIHNKKRGRGERITDNTLMRIALDLLLERKHELQGTTEDELRASVGLPPVQYGD
ncbi:hypothetical protein [Paenarthrobacter sp. YJN-5]|uniref:hypothetical protein n=1 Tax=unclassified Paenarthrobacter TaxID=2634190 RepID=UPI001D0C3962|nr:hypothetical protein [Paenarthrobacter sp. YJN-5]